MRWPARVIELTTEVEKEHTRSFLSWPPSHWTRRKGSFHYSAQAVCAHDLHSRTNKTYTCVRWEGALCIIQGKMLLPGERSAFAIANTTCIVLDSRASPRYRSIYYRGCGRRRAFTRGSFALFVWNQSVRHSCILQLPCLNFANLMLKTLTML